MGNLKGRVCLIHQVNLDEDTLEYSSSAKGNTVSGVIKSSDAFSTAITELLSLHGAERIEVALKQISYKGLYGICAKSFPQSTLTTQLLNLLFLCMGGFSGTELTHLPFPGTILDQPNIFIEAYHIYVSEYNKKVQEDRKEQQDKK